MPSKKAAEVVTVKKPDIQEFSFQIESLERSPLILHKFSQKAKEQMLAVMTSTKKAKEVRGVKDPDQEFKDSLYVLPDGRIGFPADGFKACSIRAGKGLGMVMVDMKTSFFINGEYSEADGRELVIIEPVDCEPRKREDVVKLPTGATDLRYRGEVIKWRATINVSFNRAMISPEQIINAFEAGGFGVGIGEWRPEKGGSNGRFKVVTDSSTEE